MTREQHIEWCQKRALEYVDLGDLNGAVASFQSDLMKHPETNQHEVVLALMRLRAEGHLTSAEDVRKFIEDVT